MKQNKKNILSKAGVLLIASVMILSIIPAITAENNSTDYVKEDLYSLSDRNIFEPGSRNPNINKVTKTIYNNGGFGGSFADPIIYDNGGSGLTQLLSCQLDTGATPLDSFFADDFELDEDALLTDIHWGGGFWNGNPINPSDFRVYIWEDNGNQPAGGPGDPSGAAIVTWDLLDVMGTVVLPGTTTFIDYEADLDPPFSLDGGETYWLCIQSLEETFPQYGWSATTGVTGNPGFFGSTYFAFPFWTPGASVFGAPTDCAFALTGIVGGDDDDDDVEPCLEDVCDFEILDINQAFMYEGMINELPQIINITYRNNGEVGINEVKILVDVYEKICGETTEKYCDEKYDLRYWEIETADNFTIVDDYPPEDDTWVLQGGADNRWKTNNQAWRCTKGEDRSFGGDEDKYLGLADGASPFDTDDLIFDPVDPICKNDIGGAACATFTFSHWAEGEYTFNSDGDVIPVDYGTISYCLNGSGIWKDIGINEFVAYDTNGEWRDVTIRFINQTYYEEIIYGGSNESRWINKAPYKDICPDCDPDDADIVIYTEFPTDARIQFRWSWHKDPCYQFEGWYIDDICIERTEKYYLELVHQAHVILDIEGCDPEVGPQKQYYEFELGWDPDPDTWYQMDICGQVFSPNNCELTTENNCIYTQFFVTDIHDVMCESLELITPDPTTPGSPVTVRMTIKNIGTFAEDDIPVVLKVADCVVDKIWDDDFETDPSGRWSYGTFVGSASQHFFRWTKGDATIDDIGDGRSVLPGTESFICAEEQPTYPRIPENAGCFFGDDTSHDLSDAKNATLSLYAKWSFDNINSGDDFWGIAVHPVGHPTFGGWRITGYSGYQNDFDKVSWDLLDDPSIGCRTFFAYEEDGEMVIPPMEYGIAVFTDDNDGVTMNPNNPIPWSGLIMDNLELQITTCGGDAVVVSENGTTGTLAPGDTDEVLLTWDEAEFCNHCLIADVNLATDVDPSNDMCDLCVKVVDVEEVGEFSTLDLTGEGDCLWHLCDSRGGGDDNYAWAGIEEEHWAHYVHDMDDELISPVINLSGTTMGASLNFTTWYKFYNMDDFGEVYARNSSADPWVRLMKLSGTTYGYFVDLGGNDGYYLPPELCSNNTQVKFRMVSDPADTGYYAENDVSEGWYVDDVEIFDVLSTGQSSSFAPWDLILSFDCEAATGALGNAGAEFDGTNFYSTRWASNLLHQYTDTGALVKEFSIGGVTGLRDLAYNGVNFYGGAASGTIWEMDFDAETLVDTISGSFQSRAIAYNADDDLIYCSNWGDPVWIVDPDTGNIDGTFNLGLATSTYGFAYFNDGSTKWLYVFDQSLTPSDVMIYEYNLDAMSMSGFEFDVTPYCTDSTAIAGGLFVENGGSVAPGKTVIGGLAQGTPDEMIVMELSESTGPGGDLVYGDLLWSDDFERDHIAPWQCQRSRAGNYWKHYDDNETGYTPDGAGFAEDYWVCHGYPSTGKGLNNVLYTKLDLTTAPAFDDLTFAKLGFRTAWKMEAGCEAFIEISADWDGASPMGDATWVPFWIHEGGDETMDWITSEELVEDDRFVLNQYIGNEIYIRFRYTTPGEGFGIQDDHGWAIDDLSIEFKSEAFMDEEPPVTSICFDTVTGEVTLLAVDYPIPKGSGVKATYFIVTPPGGDAQIYTGSFLLGEGTHTVEFWSEDNAGNIESRKSRTYTLDTTEPTVELISPEEGKLYLFGSPIMDRILGSGTLCIGKVPVAASATDDGSGVAVVMFAFDNGDSGFDDDGTDGFTYEYRGMHFGELTITATAVDEGGLMSTQDSMTITVYSLGLM
jgi:hypothetical protein